MISLSEGGEAGRGRRPIWEFAAGSQSVGRVTQFLEAWGKTREPEFAGRLADHAGTKHPRSAESSRAGARWFGPFE